MRKLVTVRKVKEILPIEGADNIELAKIDGWQCVVKKNELKTDDYCLYFEIDSLLPVREEFSFLANKGTKKMIHNGTEVIGYRLRTIRLRGQLSQGLALPISAFAELANTPYPTDDDFAEVLGVLLYEAPIPAELNGDVEGSFPSFIPKTDEERIQNIEENYIGATFTVTEKLDGTSCTIYMKDGLHVCGRNWEYKPSDKTMWRIARGIAAPFEGFAIQGELVGPGIQSNPLKLQKVDLYVFYIYDFVKQKYLSSRESVTLSNMLGLKHVPVIYEDCDFISCQDCLDLADRYSMLNDKVRAEGLVFRMNCERKISFKAINNAYLLKQE